jgi:hypothetical protein
MQFGGATLGLAWWAMEQGLPCRSSLRKGPLMKGVAVLPIYHDNHDNVTVGTPAPNTRLLMKSLPRRN